MPPSNPDSSELQRRLVGIADALLDRGRDYQKLTEALRDFHDLGAQLSGIRGDGPQNREADLGLPQGKAISPEYAAHTLFDRLRTQRFVQGLHDALESRPGPLHAMYAGCGPFATLALPLMTVFPASRVRWTLLDVQRSSLQAARRVVEACGFTDRVADFVEADATTYRHAGPPFQLMVTETMQNLLANEPQVAITLNLVPQMESAGILIPEAIKIDAAVSEIAADSMASGFDSLERTLAPGPEAILDQQEVLRIDAGLAREWTARPVAEPFSPVRFALPLFREGLQLSLRTTIRVWQQTRIADRNSPLCVPRVIRDWRDHARAGSVEFVYEGGRNPGLRHRFVP